VKRLVLVGGGHAHVHVLAALATRPLPGVEVTLVSPSPHHHYSGMVPGFLQGVYAEAELTLDLAWLARRAGARLVQAMAGRIDVAGQAVDAGEVRLPFDVLSLDVGADPAGLDVPGAREHAVTIRPMRQAVSLRARVDALGGAARGTLVRVVVAGAGAGGVEVALALHRRIRAAGARPEVALVEAAADVLPDYAAPVRRRAAGILARRGVAVTTGRAVDRVERDAVVLADGGRLPADLVVWLAGAAGPGLLAEAGLALDARGFLLVDPTLRAVGGAPVWAAGDCATLVDHPDTPKAGVYAVRQGPVLARNLRAALGAGTPRAYVPQKTFLSLLNTADGKALLRWHGVVSHSRFAWWLKDRIDRRFVRRYRPSP
jgi:pyridine nucleotide-disulfide oxidoreductase family protein